MLERNARALADFELYVAERFDAASRTPGEGLVGELAQRVAEGSLSRGEGLGMVGQLVVGGMETTVWLIAAAVRLLAEEPGLCERLRPAPDEIPAFVEEAVRLATPAQGNYRVTTRAVRLGGVDLPTGAVLALLWLSANRDEREFEQPDRLLLHRPNIKAHLGFGHGAHFCIGAAVARMETPSRSRSSWRAPGGSRSRPARRRATCRGSSCAGSRRCRSRSPERARERGASRPAQGRKWKCSTSLSCTT